MQLEKIEERYDVRLAFLPRNKMTSKYNCKWIGFLSIGEHLVKYYDEGTL